MLFKPHLKRDRVTDITLQDLKALGVKGLLLDVDNTLSTHGGQHLTRGLEQWLKDMQGAGVGLIILSNAKRRRVEPFANKIGLSFQSLSAKPLPFGYLRAARKLGLSRSQTAIVGDQLFTDMLGGHLSGVKTILLTPIELEDKPSFRIRRRLERFFLKRYHWKENG